jgi:hypothetical protein
MVMPGSHKQPRSGNLCGLGKEISVLLVGRLGERSIRPELGGKISVGSLQGKEDGLDEVTHGTRVTTTGGIAILDSSHVHELLSSWGRNKTSTTGSRDETNTDGTTLSSHLAGHGVRESSLTSPVSSTDRSNVQLGSSDCSTDSSRYLGSTLDSESNMSIVVSKSHKGLETSALSSRRLLLNGHDLHDLILKLVLEEVLNDFSLLDGKGEKEDLLE